MKESTKKDFGDLFTRYPELECCRDQIYRAFEELLKTVKSGNVIYVCGNGGSAADSEHIVGELVKSFKRKRVIDDNFSAALKTYGEDGEKLSNILEGGIKAVSLTSHISLSTAFANDNCPQAVFAQQLSVLGKEGDSLISISTSGNSVNCVYAAIVAKAKGMHTISLTGELSSKLSEISSVTVQVPEKETFKVQEKHLPIYHCLCAMLESEIYG